MHESIANTTCSKMNFHVGKHVLVLPCIYPPYQVDTVHITVRYFYDNVRTYAFVILPYVDLII